MMQEKRLQKSFISNIPFDFLFRANLLRRRKNASPKPASAKTPRTILLLSDGAILDMCASSAQICNSQTYTLNFLYIRITKSVNFILRQFKLSI